jgi:hypothetical protein
VIFQCVAVSVVKPSSLVGGCLFLGGMCLLHIWDQSEWCDTVRLHGKEAMDVGHLEQREGGADREACSGQGTVNRE